MVLKSSKLLKNSRPMAVPCSSKHASKLNVWGGISYRGPTEFGIFKTNMDSFLYRDILSEFLIPFGAHKYLMNFILHQDNDPKHASKLCTSFLEINNIRWVKSPPNSPDLNPIEMVWNEMKNFIRSNNPKSEDEVRGLIKRFQKALTQEKCQNYINNLKTVIKKVIENDGGWSDC
ncbi:unnamed protein product [Brachionus calyciflorus]|uniref:Tc1-like transposase DDE domain-containing protein n=1 Tax=Brachionus calyciflorus TaxID=104777 RepID=A0A814MGQ6_9BILA|nr:unnamed protein product [Brachionus calyciflorus]